MAEKVSDYFTQLLRGGGPAFPVNIGNPEGAFISPGMSMRDWFAGRAMQGFMLGLAEPLVSDVDARRIMLAIDNAARLSYAVADAMLRERERG